MKTIKTRENIDKGIKAFDKTVTWTERVKDPAVYLNEKSKETTGDSTPIEYGEEKIKYYSNRTSDEVLHSSRKIMSKFKERNINNYKTSKLTKKIINESKDKIKNTNKNIKSIPKNIERAKQVSIRTKKTAEQVAKVTIKTTKMVVKTTISAIKTMLEALNSLIGLLCSGGVLAIIIVVIICLIALLCFSVFGVFFANESKSITMTEVVRKVNAEVYHKIQTNILLSKNEDYVINYSDNNWKEVIAIYSVRYSEDKNNKEPILYLNENNINKLKKVFWDINSMTTSSKIVQEKVIEEDSLGNSTEKMVTKQITEINMNSKTKEEIMKQYNFNQEQIDNVNQLLSKEYDDLWMNLIYGSSKGNVALVNIALAEEGYIHGDKFWKWYGFDSRIEWCAVFVSWVANEAGVLNTSIPKFSGVINGINWFKERGEWENREYEPRSGDIIFFDWENDGKPDHVGIVNETKGSVVSTIEGNSSNDSVQKKQYMINSNVIYGYGVPNY